MRELQQERMEEKEVEAKTQGMVLQLFGHRLIVNVA
jgi:hypothetical protein